jgi:hypothetical protein
VIQVVIHVQSLPLFVDVGTNFEFVNKCECFMFMSLSCAQRHCQNQWIIVFRDLELAHNASAIYVKACFNASNIDYHGFVPQSPYESQVFFWALDFS